MVAATPVKEQQFSPYTCEKCKCSSNSNPQTPSQDEATAMEQETTRESTTMAHQRMTHQRMAGGQEGAAVQLRPDLTTEAHLLQTSPLLPPHMS